MASKFSKFLTFTAVIGAATAVGLAIYKKKKDADFMEDDFDDFDDIVEFDDDFSDLDAEDRSYTSIIGGSADDEEDTEEDEDLSDSLTEEEKEALSDSISSDMEDEEDDELFGSSKL